MCIFVHYFPLCNFDIYLCRKGHEYFCALLICLKSIMMNLQHLRPGIMGSLTNRLLKLKYQWSHGCFGTMQV